MRRIFAVIAILVVIVFGLAFAVLNEDPVWVDLFVAEVEVPLSVAMVGALMVGAVLGVLTSLVPLWRRSLEIARLKRQVGNAERQVQALRRPALGNIDRNSSS